MLLDILFFIISIPILIFSSEIFTNNAAKLAKSMGVSQFFIGITIVGIGTSLPEIMVADYASFTQESGIVLGNIIGSNSTNMALVLGLAFFIRKTVISDGHMFKDSVIHLLVLFFGSIIILSGSNISRPEGLILTAVYFLYILYSLQSHTIPEEKHSHDEFFVRKVFYVFAGLAGVLLGSKLMVDKAVIIADALGISTAVIALTVIALGTSLPELAVSVSAARRGFTMLILGNIVGSNITNLMLALGTASMIQEVPVDDIQFIQFNLAYMMLLSIILLTAVEKKRLSRMWGVLYLMLYFVFIGTSYSGLI